MLAGLLYTGYLILVERTRGELQPLPLLFLASLFGALFLLPAALAAGEQIIPADWTGLFALALCSQVIGQGLLVYALGHVPPLVVGIAMLTQPALSALLGWIYYGEALTPRDWTRRGDDRRRAGPGAACKSAAAPTCTNRSRRPIRPMHADSARSNPPEARPRRLAKMPCSTAGPRRRSTAPRRSSASTRRRRGSPSPKQPAANGRRVDPGRRRGDGGAVHAGADRRDEGPRPDPALIWFRLEDDGPGARGGAHRRLSILAMPQNVGARRCASAGARPT